MSSPSTQDHRMTFLRGFLKHPKMVGSVIPSSRFLEKRLVRSTELADAAVIVELGPGTGGTTRALLRDMRPDARLLAIELNPAFAEHLRAHVADPRLIVHEGSATDIAAALDRHGLDAPDVILSGIPFSTMEEALGLAILRSVRDSLAPGGRFVAYQFRDRVNTLGRDVFGRAPRGERDPERATDADLPLGEAGGLGELARRRAARTIASREQLPRLSYPLVMLETRCLCGDHVWAIEPPLALLHHCHCTYCRKHQGSAFTTMGAPQAFEWLARGETIEYPSSPGMTRVSCARCGSCIPADAPDTGPHFVFAGPLEGEPGAPIDGHIFAADKAGWFEIEDGLPAFPGYPPGYDAPALETPVAKDPPADGARGSCLCGAVRFVASGPALAARHCHCLRCRRARSALHASNLVVGIEGFRFTAGEALTHRYKVPDARYFTQSFCSKCGSCAPTLDPGRGIVIIPLGVLDDEPPARPDEHIFVGSKASWYEIPGKLHQYPEGPPVVLKR